MLWKHDPSHKDWDLLVKHPNCLGSAMGMPGICSMNTGGYHSRTKKNSTSKCSYFLITMWTSLTYHPLFHEVATFTPATVSCTQDSGGPSNSLSPPSLTVPHPILFQCHFPRKAFKYLKSYGALFPQRHLAFRCISSL